MSPFPSSRTLYGMRGLVRIDRKGSQSTVVRPHGAPEHDKRPRRQGNRAPRPAGSIRAGAPVTPPPHHRVSRGRTVRTASREPRATPRSRPELPGRPRTPRPSRARAYRRLSARPHPNDNAGTSGDSPCSPPKVGTGAPRRIPRPARISTAILAEMAGSRRTAQSSSGPRPGRGQYPKLPPEQERRGERGQSNRHAA